MKFGSVCSGIEAASVAWEPLGWKAAWFAEIEPFPSAVLAHHYPDTPNLGDMTAIARRVLTAEVEAPDMLCGGTPCQAFSVAGLRESLSDDRGNLTLKFVELADAIDHVRVRAGKPAAVVFWENVPGVLSTKDNAFGCFLAGLAGEDDPLQPPGGKWSNAGAVYGPQRAVAWRTLDAQYFGVAQRRRRVFVVASARNDFDPAAVLFEWDGVRRDSAPSREQGKVAPTTPSRSTAGGGLGTDFDCDGGVVQVCPTLRAGGNKTGGDRPPGTDVDTADSLIPVAFDTTQITSKANYSNPKPGDPCHPLAAGMHAPAIAFPIQECMVSRANLNGTGTGIGNDGDPMFTLQAAQPHGVVAFPANLSGTQCASTEDLAPAMGAKNPTGVAYTTKLHNTARRGEPPRSVRGIVLEASGQPRPTPKHRASPNCGKPLCVAPKHSAWVTVQERQQQLAAQGRYSSLSRTIQKARTAQARSRWTWDDIRAMRAKHAAGATIHELVAEFGMKRSGVHRVVTYKSWIEYQANPFAGLFTGLAANDAGRKRA